MKMRVLLIEPEKAPVVTEIDSSLEAMQAAVGGYIQAVYPFDDPVAVVCNEEGKMLGLPLNRALYLDDGKTMYDIISGPFLVCGLGEGDFCSLSDELIQKYTECLAMPEMFLELNGQIIAVPVKHVD